MKQLNKKNKREKYMNSFFWIRLLAFIVDVLIIKYLIAQILLWIIGFLFNLFEINFNELLVPENQNKIIKSVSFFIILLNSFIYILYCSFLESSKLKSTFGKYFFRFIVTDLSGNKISFMRAFSRNALKLLSFATLGIGFFIIDLTKRKQSLHDLISKAQIIRR